MTPSGRLPVPAGLLAGHPAEGAPCPAAALSDKWAVLRDLVAARRAFGISDRDLAVLQALISFLPGPGIATEGPSIVFPSNAALAARAHGMAESTLRRHLAALVAAGLVLRHDSPNGKRYAARGAGGAIARAFGFDLRPLALRAVEIAAHAGAAREEAEALRRMRETAVLHLRDLVRVVACLRTEGTEWEEAGAELALLQRALRRRMTHAAATELAARAGALLVAAEARLATRVPEHDLPLPDARRMGGNDARNERHIQDSDRDSIESEPAISTQDAAKDETPEAMNMQRLPLSLVLSACPDLLPYAERPPTDWRDLVNAAARVGPMMGIASETWHEAQSLMGREAAAIAVACILQRIAAIPRPGAYLRTLARKSSEGAFSPGPMVMALLRAESLGQA